MSMGLVGMAIIFAVALIADIVSEYQYRKGKSKKA